MGATKTRARGRPVERDRTVASAPVRRPGSEQAGDVAHPVHALQRQVGNQAVTQLLQLHQLAVAGKVKLSKAEAAAINAVLRDPSRLPTAGSFGMEVVKPSGVGLAAGGAYLGGALSGGGSNDLGGGLASGVVGGAVMADSALKMAYASKRKANAKALGDTAGMSVADMKMRQGGWGLTGSAVGTTQTGLKIGAAAGSKVAHLASAAGGLGIAGGVVTAADGMWKVYKAAGKLWNLGKQKIFTAKGEQWKERVANRLKWKAGVGSLKTMLGGLGIAAGALALASNPVGWAVGIAAAVAGGVWAITKIVGKLWDAYKRREMKKKILKADPDGSKRRDMKALADEVARELSGNAKTAGAMVAALHKGNAYAVRECMKAIQLMNATVGKADPTVLPRATADDHEQHDAITLLAVLNITPEEAKTPSGQERIEKKMSVAEMA